MIALQQYPVQPNWQPPRPPAAYPPAWQRPQWGPPPQQCAPGPTPQRGPRKVSAAGSTGLALSVLGLFLLPLVFGLAGLICGVVDVATARAGQRSPGTGWAAIIVGAIALIVGLAVMALAVSGA